MAEVPVSAMSIDAARSSFLITLLQIFGTVSLAVAGVLLYLIINGSDSSATAKLMGFIFLGIAVILGLVGLWGSLPFDIIELSKLEIVPTLNNIFVMGAILCFVLSCITGVWNSRMYTDVGKLESTKLLLVLVFSFTLVAFQELASTSNHLYTVKKFAKRNNLKKDNLNLNVLSGKYLLWFAVLFSIIFVYSWFIIDLQNVIIKMMGDGYTIALPGGTATIEGLSHQFANSLILNSIYGVALSMAIIIIPFAILIALIFGGEGKMEEEYEGDDLM